MGRCDRVATARARRRHATTVWRALSATALLLVPGGASAEDAAGAGFGRPGFRARSGVAVALVSSQSLDELNAALFASAANGLLPLLPAGSTIDVVRLDARTAIGVAVGLGYRIHPRLGVEAAFDWARGDIDFVRAITVPTLGTLSDTFGTGTWTAWQLTTDLQLYLATGRVQPYAAIGLGAIAEEFAIASRSFVPFEFGQVAFAPRFGGGVDVYLTRHIALGADAGYALGTGSLDGEDVITVRIGLIGRL